MKPIVWILALLFTINVVSGVSGDMKLLAVAMANDGNLSGHIASLSLEIVPGTGRVYIDTSPFTQLDTQISTRFAKDIACNFVNVDCDHSDFFYSIRSSSPIIGGPSAGGAISILTSALLKGIPFNKNYAMTGTINSGGVIGPVSGIREKIDAASAAGIDTVFIPSGTRKFKDEENATIDLVEVGRLKGVKVSEVSDLNQAMEEFTGVNFYPDQSPLAVDQSYSEVMKTLGDELCMRSTRLAPISLENESIGYEYYTAGVEYTKKAENASLKKEWYSRASFCFSANIQFDHLYLITLNETQEQTMRRIALVEKDIAKVESLLESQSLNTITDLQAYSVVRERLNDAKRSLNQSEEQVMGNDTGYAELAYAIERMYSAVSWSQYFGKPGEKVNLDKEHIRLACLKKLEEAKERVQYSSLIFTQFFDRSKDLDRIQSLQDDEEYISCLFAAAQLKAEANLVLTSLGITDETFPSVIATKRKIVEKTISRQIEKGSFPIVGYSYFEYSKEFEESDKSSSLLYLEYALELSDLSIYFPSEIKKAQPLAKNWSLNPITYFLLGSGVGFFLGMAFRIKLRKKNKKENFYP